MEKIFAKIIPFLKLGLAILFLYNIGLFSLFNNLDHGPNPPFKKDRGRGDTQYLKEKVERAQKLGDAYGPEEYFSDLTDIRIKEKKNDFDRMAYLNIQNSVSRMQEVFNNNVKNARRLKTDAEYDMLMKRLSDARSKHLEILEPGTLQKQLARDAEIKSPGYWPGFWRSVFLWLVNFWWSKMPFGFVLLLLWYYQEKATFRINNPLSFLICLTLYPLVIIRAWVKIFQLEARVMAMKIELKRRDLSIFSLISENELSDIRHFAKSNLKLSEYRKHLDGLGFVRRQALFPVLIVTIVFLLIPKNTKASFSENLSSCQCQIVVKAPPGFIDNTQQTDNLVFTEALLPKNINLSYCLKVILLILLPPDQKEKDGFGRSPDPVPLFA